MFNRHILFNKKKENSICVWRSDNFTHAGIQPNFSQYQLNSVDVFFAGKTYKWSIKHNYWKLVFNRAHKTYLFFQQSVFLKKFSKTKIRFFTPNICDRNTIVTSLNKVRGYNIFTQRGLKIKGQLVYKKKGKISTYR